MSTTPPEDPTQRPQPPSGPGGTSDPATVDPETGTDPSGTPVENPSG
jgi:hypothetical protein